VTLVPSHPAPEVEAAALLAAEHAEQTDQRGRIPDAVAQSLHDTGLLAHFVPEAFGGAAGRFSTVLPALVRLADADPSVGWCAAVMTSMSRMAAHLPPAGQKALWSTGPHVPIAGTLQPAGTATPTDGGWAVSGRWPFASGVHHARWALLCTVPDDDPQPRFLLVPRSSWATEPSWEGAVGLRGTGSDTLRLDGDVFVPRDHSFTRQELFTASESPGAGACYRVPHEAVSGLFFAAPLLGAARAALTAWTDQARTRPAASEGSRRDTDTPVTAAAGTIDAAELLLHRAAAVCDSPDTLTSPLAARCRRDYAVAAHLLSGAVQQLFQSAGVRAASGGGALPRLWRDASTAALHPALSLDPAARAYAQEVLYRVP
jgi:two-component flavin-dependent monooxygenase